MAQVGDVRERPARIERERREDGECLFYKVLVGSPALILIELIVVQKMYSFGSQL